MKSMRGVIALGLGVELLSGVMVWYLELESLVS